MLSQLPNRITSPSWWQLINWIADPLGFQDKYSRKYGDIFTMRLSGLGSYVVVGNPQAIQELFSLDSKFDVGRANELAKPLIGQNSVMLMDGNRHRRERKLLMPPFHGERLQTYAQQICLITEQVANQWQVGQPFVARTAMQKVSLEVILQIVPDTCHILVAGKQTNVFLGSAVRYFSDRIDQSAPILPGQLWHSGSALSRVVGL